MYWEIIISVASLATAVAATIASVTYTIQSKHSSFITFYLKILEDKMYADILSILKDYRSNKGVDWHKYVGNPKGNDRFVEFIAFINMMVREYGRLKMFESSLDEIIIKPMALDNDFIGLLNEINNKNDYEDSYNSIYKYLRKKRDKCTLTTLMNLQQGNQYTVGGENNE